MATDSILRPGELKEILLKEIQTADLAEIDVREVGTVLEVKDGIARIYGLTSAMAGEMLEFTASESGDKVVGQALNLEEDNIGAVIFGNYLELREGDEVRRTGRVLDVPVGPALVGRAVDALGRPVDGRGPIQTTKTRKVDSGAPGIIKRQPVKGPLQTGMKAIDSLIPLVRGPLPGGARPRVPGALARAAAGAGPPGLRGRRALPPQPARRTVGEALRRRRSRLAHCPRHRRDPGGGHLGLHSRQRRRPPRR